MGVFLSEIEDGSRKTDLGAIFDLDVSLPEILDKTEKKYDRTPEETNEFFSKKVLSFIAIGLSVRFFLAPFFIDTHDMASFFLATKDMVEGHSPYSSANYAYPPLVMIIYYPLFLFLSLFVEPSEWFSYSNDIRDSSMTSPLLTPIVTTPIFNFVWKIPLILSDLFSAYFIFKIARLSGSSINFSSRVAMAYFLNPLTIYVSSVMGQTDGVMAAFLIASIYYILKEQTVTAGMFMAMSTSVKGYVIPLGVTICGYLVVKKYQELRDKGTKFSTGGGYLWDIMKEPIRFGLITGCVGLLFLIPMFYWGGDLFVSRRIQADFRFGGIHPFVFGSIITSDILQGSEGYKQSGNQILDVIVFLKNFIRIEYSVTIFILLYYYLRLPQAIKEIVLLKGCVAHLYIILMFGIGNVNTQYYTVIFPMIFTILAMDRRESISLNSEVVSGFFVSLYSIGIVSFFYLAIPLAAHTDFIDLIELLKVIEDDWIGYGFATGKKYSTRWVVLGSIAWFSVTFSVIKSLSLGRNNEVEL